MSGIEGHKEQRAIILECRNIQSVSKRQAYKPPMAEQGQGHQLWHQVISCGVYGTPSQITQILEGRERGEGK